MPVSPSEIDLQTIAAREAALLAPYAMFSADSRGRKYPEPVQAYRGPYQRDRDRIVHSAAYRRLSGKMQVFTGEMGDYHRTRLTHTHEVASIARTLGRTLRLNEDLIESLALFHDIGHPPYGHAGEDALDECLEHVGGFSHNQFALSLAEDLEVRYPNFPGLNLSREVLDGQKLRATKIGGELADDDQALAPLLEVQVVDLADSITYDAHDTDDAVKLGLIPLETLLQAPLVQEAAVRVQRLYGKLSDTLRRQAIVHEMIDMQVSDVLNTSGRELLKLGFENSLAARQSDFRIRVSDEFAEKKRQLERDLYQQVYRHPQLIEVRSRAQDRLRTMYHGYLKRPELLPEKFQHRVEQVGLERGIGDYLAGMTDRYCDDLYQRHFIDAKA